MSLRIESVAVDANDPAALAAFWQGVLGGNLVVESDEEIALEPPFEGPDLLFLRVPDGKSVKNRLHLDLRPEDQAAEVARLKSLGARRIDIGQGADVTWVVLADPEGNEFCVLRALPPEELPQQA